jgi:hypothetical protein
VPSTTQALTVGQEWFPFYAVVEDKLNTAGTYEGLGMQMDETAFGNTLLILGRRR